MIVNTNNKWNQLSDAAILEKVGEFVKQQRIGKNKTQAQLAEMSGLNRWTISQLENGESVTLSSLIQVLRALDCLYVLNELDVSQEISPLEYIKLKKHQRERVRNNPISKPDNEDVGW